MTPVSIISGYLGAGKTTLIQEFLQDPGPRRACVLVNDFGKINLDAAFIEQMGADTIALTNGCACCSIGDDLLAAVQKVVGGPIKYDLIIVEASGVAQPGRLKMLVTGASGTEPAQCLTVVNMSKARALSRDKFVGQLFRQQTEQADALFLNRGQENTDINLLPKDKPRFTSLQDFLSVNSHSVQEADVVIEAEASPLFRQEFISLVDGLTETELRDWCAKLSSSVHRAKGYVRLKDDISVKVDFVQGQLNIVPVKQVPSNQQSGLVVIRVAGAA